MQDIFQVFSLIVHEEFNHRLLENDIALMKLKSEVAFNDYIQPACVWYPKVVNKLQNEEIFGTVSRYVLTSKTTEIKRKIYTPINNLNRFSCGSTLFNRKCKQALIVSCKKTLI